jgi:hypothetical protein
MPLHAGGFHEDAVATPVPAVSCGACPTVHATHDVPGRVIMGDKSSQKTNTKKEGKSLKEKRAVKKAKTADKSGTTIPTTGR